MPTETELLEKALEPAYHALASLKRKGSRKLVVMGKARIIEKRPDGDRVYKVTFHHTVEDET